MNKLRRWLDSDHPIPINSATLAYALVATWGLVVVTWVTR